MLKPLLTLLIFCCSLAVFAQNPSLRIDKVYSENYCLGTELSIDVTITGVFPADNKFTIVAFRDWNDPAKRWEYPAELRGNKLVTILKDPILANAESFGIRVISSNPQTETDGYYSFKALTKSTVKLTTKWGYTADTLNSTDPIALSFTTTPMSPGEITMNTGDKFQLQYSSYDWANGYTTFASLPKTKEGIYFIKEASNACGPMNVSGQVTVKVNTIDFMPVSISPEQPCEGSEIKVIFSTDKADFNANTKFKIRFSTDNVNFGSYKYLDAPAVLTGKNQLTAKFPPGFNASMLNQGIYIGIVTENPSAISINKALKIYVNLKPSFSFTPASASINMGENIWISSNPQGMAPYKFTLTNGKIFDYNLILNPEKTTQYQVKTFESGCGIIENPAHSPLIITVKPSLFLGEPETTTILKPFCEGQTVRMRYRASGVNSQTSYTLEGTTNSNEKFVFPAKVLGDSLEFFVPKNTAQNPNRDYGDIYGLRIVSANPTLVSPYSSVRIQSQPYMTLADNSPKSVPYPSAIRMDYNLSGGGPYIAEMVDGIRQSYDYRNIWYYQFIRQDTTFKLASLSNQCFRSTDLPAFPLKVVSTTNTTPALFARLIKKDYCMGDSVEVEISFSGKFEAGNQFTLYYLRSGQIETYLIQNLIRSGIYKVKLPERPNENYDASLQISSSLPRLISETDRFYFKLKPQKPTIDPEAKKEQPVKLFLGQSPRVAVSSIPYSLISYSFDGKEKSDLADYNGRLNIPLDLTINKISEFKVNSVSNSCGNYTAEISSFFFGIGYKIILNRNVYTNWHCVDSDTELRFALESGNAGPNTKFTLQISASGSQDSYTDVATTDSRLFKFVTPNLQAGNYYVRVRSSDEIYSEPINILIGSAPTAVFRLGYGSTASDTTVSVDYGSQVYLNTYLKGNDPWGLIYNDGKQDGVTSNYATYATTITTQQTFSVSKVWNSCGYGTSSGTVTVKVKPVLELKKYPENSEAIICAGQKVQLDYQIKGTESLGKDYLVFSIWGDKKGPVKLDSVSNLSGRTELKIPDNIVGQYFYIKAEIASFQVSKQIVYQIYSSPDITLFGDNTISEGESTTLYVRANNTFAYNTSFELSDGNTYTINSSFPNGITEIKIQPKATVTYTLKELKSTCGVGKVSGSATVTVQPKLSQWLSIQRIEGLKKSNVCSSDTISIYFNLNGSQTSDTEYNVLLSDSTGKNFVSIPTSGKFSPVKAIVPAGIKQSNYYKIRLTSKDQKISGSTYPDRLRIGEYALAKIVTPALYYQPSQSVNVIIGLEGSAPFYYRFGDDNFYQYRNTAKYSDTIRLMPVTPMANYKIIEVGNECGIGKIGNPSSFQIELVTATEPVSGGEIIKFGPNPTRDELFIQFENSYARQLEVLDIKGSKIYTGKSVNENARINLSAFPPGVYLLKIRKKQITTTYRIVKY